MWARQSVLECGERRTCAGENIKLCYVYRVRSGKCHKVSEHMD